MIDAPTPTPPRAPGEVAAEVAAALAARDGSRLGAVLAEDAVWQHPGQPDVHGRAAILQSLDQDPSTLRGDGPLRITRGTEVAWPSVQSGGVGASELVRHRVDVVDVASGVVRSWTTLVADGPSPAVDARAAALEQYVERVGRADAEGALKLFADACSVEDPVGTPVHEGRASVEAFYRGGLAAITGTTPMGPPIVSGDVGAIAFRVDLALPDRAIALEVIDLMRFDQAHRFTSMRAFWGRSNRLSR